MSDLRGPGWYDDPAGDLSQLRWWDGAGWTGIVRARAPFEQPAGPFVVADGAYGRSVTATATVVSEPDILLDEQGARPRSRSRWVLALLGVVLVGLLALTGIVNLGGNQPQATEATVPSGLPLPGQTAPSTELPTQAPTQTASPHPVSGRLTDIESGLSYSVLPGRWLAWDGVRFDGFVSQEGYYRVVQRDAPGGDYWANVTSGLVLPAPTDDLKVTAQALIDRLDSSYYPKHTRSGESARATTVDGHSAYLIRYVAVFDPSAASGYMAKSEQVTLLVVNTDRGLPAALYASLPDTVKSLWPSTDSLIKSVRVLPR